MANVYIEPRPKGRPEGSSIDDYVIEDHADRVTCHVQNAARSNRLGKKEQPFAACRSLRHLNDKESRSLARGLGRPGRRHSR